MRKMWKEAFDDIREKQRHLAMLLDLSHTFTEVLQAKSDFLKERIDELKKSIEKKGGD